MITCGWCPVNMCSACYCTKGGFWTGCSPEKEKKKSPNQQAKPPRNALPSKSQPPLAADSSASHSFSRTVQDCLGDNEAEVPAGRGEMVLLIVSAEYRYLSRNLPLSTWQEVVYCHELIFKPWITKYGRNPINSSSINHQVCVHSKLHYEQSYLFVWDPSPNIVLHIALH